MTRCPHRDARRGVLLNEDRHLLGTVREEPVPETQDTLDRSHLVFLCFLEPGIWKEQEWKSPWKQVMEHGSRRPGLGEGRQRCGPRGLELDVVHFLVWGQAY